MPQIVPLKKQSKQKQREYYAKQRGTWNGLCPVSRVVPNERAYDRNRAKRETREAAE